MRADRTPDPRRLLTAAESAELLATDLADVHDLLSSGQLRGLRLTPRGGWRVEVDELDRFIADRLEVERRGALWRGANLASIAEIRAELLPGA